MEDCVLLILNTAIASGVKAMAVLYPLLSSATDLQSMGANSIRKLSDDSSQVIISSLKDVRLKVVLCFEAEVGFLEMIALNCAHASEDAMVLKHL